MAHDCEERLEVYSSLKTQGFRVVRRVQRAESAAGLRADQCRVLATLSQPRTRNQIAFYAGLHPDRAKAAIDSLVKAGEIEATIGEVTWGGRGNGVAFTVREERPVYGRKRA